MFKFYKKYQLGFKIFLFIGMIAVIVLNIFYADETDNKNFTKFSSFIYGLMAIFLLKDIISLIIKKSIE
jgi:hypothetical protein